MVDLKWFINFFFLFVIIAFVLKVISGGALPIGIVLIPLLLFIGTLFLGSKS